MTFNKISAFHTFNHIISTVYSELKARLEQSLLILV